MVSAIEVLASIFLLLLLLLLPLSLSVLSLNYGDFPASIAISHPVCVYARLSFIRLTPLSCETGLRCCFLQKHCLDFIKLEDVVLTVLCASQIVVFTILYCIFPRPQPLP